MTSDADPQAALDARYLAAAIRLGRRELGRTWPNPAVGCLIVARLEGAPAIVGRGWTFAGGRPHAETVALAEAGEAARGADAYVSLEPCSHHGRTPPCTDALIDAGVARVISTGDDPDDRVRGRGHAALRANGVAVRSGLLAGEGRRANAGHVCRAERGRPWVTLKLATSSDGRIAAEGGRPVAITGAEARARVHMMRALADCVLVGVGTVLADDPELTCRLPGMAGRSPVRVVLDTELRTPTEARLFATRDAAPVWLVAAEDASDDRAEALSAAGAEVIRVARDGAGRTDGLAALKALGVRGVTSVMVEGGAEVAASLQAADLVDDAVVFEAPHEIGARGLPAGPALAAVRGSGAYTRLDERRIGNDLMATYQRTR